MAQNIIIAGAQYSAVPSIEVPMVGGGTATYKDATSRLPAAYQEVEYIQAVQGAYINTGIVPVVGDKFTLEFASTTTGEQIVMGSRKSGTYNTSQNQFYVYVSAGVNITVYSGTSVQPIKTTTLNVFEEISFFVRSGMSEQTDRPLYLCAFYDRGNVNNFFYGRVAKLLHNATEKFIPCYRKSDSEPGMYDLGGSICSLTNSPFYINSGNGSFLVGGDVN